MRDKRIYNKKEFIALAKYGNLMGAFKYHLEALKEKSNALKTYRPIFEKYKDVILKYDNSIVPPSNSPTASSHSFGEHNMGDKVSATPTPKEATLPSHHPNIKLNRGFVLQR